MQDLTAIIMAAGFGSRLGEHAQGLPKAIIEVGGQPLVWYAINLAKKIGAERIIVVGGWQFDKVAATVLAIDPAIEVYENKQFNLGNLYSLEEALKQVNESFLLMHVDHIFNTKVADKIKEQLGENIVVFTDHDRDLSDDDMKVVATAGGAKLADASKQLPNSGLGYVGLTYCHASFLPVYKQAVAEAKEVYREKAVTEQAMLVIARGGQADVAIGDISGYGWLEIDTPDDLVRARQELSINVAKYI